MLPYRRHGRNAFQQDPEKEARLLYAKPLWTLTDDELSEAVKSGIVDAQSELTVRQHIRDMMDGFKNRIVQKIEAGDEVDPAGADTTANKEEFADIFLEHDTTLNNMPSNTTLKADYKTRIFEGGIVSTPIAGDVEANRKTIADAIDHKKQTLQEECIRFAEEQYPTKSPDEAVDLFIQSRTKAAEKKLATDNRATFAEALKKARENAIKQSFREFAQTSNRTDPYKMVEDYYRSKSLTLPPAAELAPLISIAEEHRRTVLQTELKEFVESGIRYRRKQEAIDAFILEKGIAGAPDTPDQTILRDPQFKPMLEKAAEEAICKRHNAIRAEQITPQYDKIIEEIEGTQNKLEAAILALQNKAGIKDPKDIERLYEWRSMLATYMAIARANSEEVAKISAWQRGTSTDQPELLAAYISPSVPPSELVEFDTRFREQIVHTPNASTDEWEKIHGSPENVQTKRKKVLDDLCTDEILSVAIAEKLENLQQVCGDIKSALVSAGIKDTADKLKDMANKVEDEELAKKNKTELKLTLFQKIQKLNNDLGITWITPYQVYMGVKKYIDNYRADIEDINRRKISAVTSSIANAVAEIMPTAFNNAVKQRAKSTIDSEDNKVKDEFINTLKSGPASFNDLFKQGGSYDSNQHDYNLNRAVLEYAASRGWLYDMDPENNIVMGRTLVNGGNLPPGQDEKEYIDQLREINTKGMNSEKQRGVEIVDREGDFDKIFIEFKHQLELRNYMAAVGIIERTIGKGKKAHTVTQLTVAFVRHIRSDTNAWKYIHFNVIEALKGIGYGYPLFTTAMLDHSLPKTIKKRERDPFAMKKGGTFTATLEQLEAEIDMQAPGLKDRDQEQFDELVAKALSGQTISSHVDKNGDEQSWSHAVTLFGENYKAYRADMAASARPNNLNYEKMQDFLHDSELLLTGSPVFNKIFTVGSTDDFDNAEMAQQFSGDIIKRYDVLYDACARGTVSIETLRQYQEKFCDLWDDYFANTPRANAASQINLRTDAGDRIFESMYMRGLIREKTLKEKEAANSPLAKAILQNAAQKPKKITPTLAP